MVATGATSYVYIEVLATTVKTSPRKAGKLNPEYNWFRNCLLPVLTEYSRYFSM